MAEGAAASAAASAAATAPATAPAQAAAWVYRFDYSGGALGAAHGSELPLLFGSAGRHWLLERFSGAAADRGGVREVSAQLMSSFASFARGGVPELEAGVAWPAFDAAGAEGGRALVFDRRCRVEPVFEDSAAVRKVAAQVRSCASPWGVRGMRGQRPQARL